MLNAKATRTAKKKNKQTNTVETSKQTKTKSNKSKGDVTRDDLQRRFLAQHRVQTLEQYCSYSKQCNINVLTLCCAKNDRCESSQVTTP